MLVEKRQGLVYHSYAENFTVITFNLRLDRNSVRLPGAFTELFLGKFIYCGEWTFVVLYILVAMRIIVLMSIKYGKPTIFSSFTHKKRFWSLKSPSDVILKCHCYNKASGTWSSKKSTHCHTGGIYIDNDRKFLRDVFSDMLCQNNIWNVFEFNMSTETNPNVSPMWAV